MIESTQYKSFKKNKNFILDNTDEYIQKLEDIVNNPQVSSSSKNNTRSIAAEEGDGLGILIWGLISIAIGLSVYVLITSGLIPGIMFGIIAIPIAFFLSFIALAIYLVNME